MSDTINIKKVYDAFKADLKIEAGIGAEEGSKTLKQLEKQIMWDAIKDDLKIKDEDRKDE